MQVIIKNRFFTLKGGSTVKDPEGKDIFRVKGKFFTITNKKFICDLDGNRLYTVRNKYWRLWGHKCFVYNSDGHKVATAYHPPFALKKILVQGAEDEITINGELFTLNYSIMRNGEEIGKITNKFLTLTDTYCLEADEKDMPFLVALVIALDNIRDRITKPSSSRRR